jgi:hypothetical protein
MQPTNRLRTYTIASFAVIMLVFSGMRCNSATPPAPAQKPAERTYIEKTILDPVIWPASSTISQAALAAMKPEEVLKIASSGVPVLVPSDPKILGAGIVVVAGENGYNFGTAEPVDGIYYSMGGGRLSHQYIQTSGPPAPEVVYNKTPENQRFPIRGNKGVGVSGSEAGDIRAGWMEYGEAGYHLSIACEKEGDPRCADTDYLLSLVKNLVYVGGNGK